MSDNLFISEIIFLVIGAISLSVALEFYRSKNGMLRKIMITYFLVEVFIYLASGIYFWMAEVGHTGLAIGYFRVMVITPKMLVLLWLLYWLRNKT